MVIRIFSFWRRIKKIKRYKKRVRKVRLSRLWKNVNKDFEHLPGEGKTKTRKSKPRQCTIIKRQRKVERLRVFDGKLSVKKLQYHFMGWIGEHSTLGEGSLYSWSSVEQDCISPTKKICCYLFVGSEAVESKLVKLTRDQQYCYTSFNGECSLLDPSFTESLADWSQPSTGWSTNLWSHQRLYGWWFDFKAIGQQANARFGQQKFQCNLSPSNQSRSK